jgi:replication factor C large subunit
LNSKLDPETLTKALNALSKADELAGRIRRTQEWRLLRYFDEILVYSLMAVLPRGAVKYSEYKFPWNLQLRIWNDSRILKEIGQKLGKLINTSSKEAIIDYLPYLLYTLKDKKMVESVSKQLALSESGERVIQKEISRLRRP